VLAPSRQRLGVFTSGLVPIRPSNADPALPIDGRGYTNRPSGIQQVLGFGGHSPQDTGR
jgi:hypothetical protein